MYNVEFGDCFLICDSSENLLVDFGSDNPACNFDGIADHIQAESQGKDLSVLISHFHEDHISGLLGGKLRFSTIYLPDVISIDKSGRKLTFIQLQVLEDIFRCVILNSKLNITLYNLLIQLCNVRSNIVFLQRGSEFCVSGRKYRVLWPSFKDTEIDKRVQKHILQMLGDSRLGVIPSKAQKNSNSNDNEEKIQQKRQDQKWEIDLFNEDNLEYIKIDEIDDFVDTVIKGYKMLAQHSDLSLKDKEKLHTEYSRLEYFVDGLKQKVPSSNNKIMTELKELSFSMKKQANKISVVFHDSPKDNVSNILMTGDIPPSEFKKILTDVENISYHAVKAPHHATGTYFTPFLPECEVIMASNGEPRQNHNRWHKISYQYGSFYCSHKKSEIICSTQRCELIDLSKVPDCANCRKDNIHINSFCVSVIDK